MTDTITPEGIPTEAPPAEETSQDFTPLSLGGGLELNADTLRKLAKQIEGYDEVIDAASGGRGVLALRREMAKETETQVEQLFQQLQKYLQSALEASPRALVGIVDGLSDKMEKVYADTIKKTVDEAVAKEKESVSPVSKEAAEKAIAARAQDVKAFKALKSALATFVGEDSVAGIPDPKVRRASGKRGTQIWGKYQYSVDGANLEGDSNSLKGVAAVLGFEKISAVKEALISAGMPTNKKGDINTANLPVEFEYTINGKVVKATALDEFKSEWDASGANVTVDSDDDNLSDEDDDNDDETSADETETA